MKKTTFFLFTLFCSLVYGQIPQGISYQAIALNNTGNPVVSSNVGLRVSILDNSSTGTVLYVETHTKTTNAQGLFNTVIGQGTPVTGTFSAINWGTNSKFLKAEMDITGGANYVLIGTTQLLSVPYAMTAASIKTLPGQGITLTSPNGTPYSLSVNDSGQLSLPTSGTTQNYPNQLYMFGSYNNFNASTAELLRNDGGNLYRGYKYLTSGTQIKLTSDTSGSGQVFGVDGNLNLVLNGSNHIIPSNGFYFIRLQRFNTNEPLTIYTTSISPKLNIAGVNINPTYNSTTNTFSFIINGLTDNFDSDFNFIFEDGFNGFTSLYGDNLSDGTIEKEGTKISFPNLTSTPKNFRVNLSLNFNGSGTYTITQI